MAPSDENSVSPKVGKRRPPATTSRHPGRGAYSFARIVCAAAVAHGCLCRGAALAAAAPLGRPAVSMLAAAAATAATTTAVAGGRATSSSPGPARALLETPRGGGSSRNGGGGFNRYAPSTAADTVFQIGHREAGMVDIISRRCLDPSCTRRPLYNTRGSAPVFCSRHRLPGMVDVVSSRCQEPGCMCHPSFGYTSDKKARRCARHRLENMEGVKRHRSKR